MSTPGHTASRLPALFRRGARRPGIGVLFVGAALLLSHVHAALGETPFTAAQRQHWAFQPMGQPAVPTVTESAWVREPIDAFVARDLAALGLTPGPEADRRTLLRRVTLDLTGLPPTPAETEAFLADASTDAYERVVERLLASPHFGERWARPWLDLARYAESEGFKADETRPNVWRYRDYVIRSLNADKPYDRFVEEQLAGDELWPGDPEALIATGFNRHYPDESNARNLVQRRQEILNDITDTVGFVFTGLTFACARCHDHKWDPITQADYFRLQAFFANTTAADTVALVSEKERAQTAAQQAAWESVTAAAREEIACLEQPGRDAILWDYVEKYPEDIQKMLAKPASARNPFEQQMVAKANLYLDPASPQYLAPGSAAAGSLRGEVKARWSELQSVLKSYESFRPASAPVATVMRDLGAECPSTHVLKRGLWNSPGEEVRPGFLEVLGGEDAVASPVPSGTSGRRAALARWLVRPENPLTARVLVNRLWSQHFGRGLVGTPSDFGMQGEPPTHPELLDWLARDFVAHGWSMKHVHRRLVLSATYRQSSGFRVAAARLDPGNQKLWRFPRRRLDAEMIRDSLLAVAGRLNPRAGGPSVFPELPPGMVSRGGWPVTREAGERDRRSIYVFVRRNTRYPMFETFDMPDTHESCARRNATTSPGQALTLLNSGLTLDWARSFAARVLELGGREKARQIEAAWQLAWSRNPSEEELTEALNFLAAQREILTARDTAREPLALPPHPLAESDRAGAAALTDLCHALFNANEMVYLN